MKLTRYQLKNNELSRLKIVFVTDWHLAANRLEKWRVQKIIDQINAQKADIVLLGGDYVNGHKRSSAMNADEMQRFFKQIQPPVYAVLGNHDSYYGKNDVIRILAGAGVHVLDNTSVSFNLKGRQITLAGIADFYTDSPDVSKSLKNGGENIILLTHSPDSFSLLEKNWAQLAVVLAGHTHGGQIVFPFVGAPFVPLDVDKRFKYGLFYQHGTPLIVSRGLGTSLLPIRFNCVPEIVVVDFK